jgi:hypothetical protein
MLETPSNGYGLNFQALDWLTVARLGVDVVAVGGREFVVLGPGTTTGVIIAAAVDVVVDVEIGGVAGADTAEVAEAGVEEAAGQVGRGRFRPH